MGQKLLPWLFYVDWVTENYLVFIFRGKIGIALGECHFQCIADERQTASCLVTEALMKAPKLQLLMVILPGKTPLYGRYL